MPDFIPNDTSSTQGLQLAAGGMFGSYSGSLEKLDDSDWIRVTLTAGITYRFDAHAKIAGFFGDSYLSLRDAAGNVVVSDDSSGPDLDSSIQITATATGTYFMEVRQAGGDRGEYSLSMMVGASVNVDGVNGANTWNGAAGAARYRGGFGDDIIAFDADDLDALGGQGSDQITANGLANTIFGGLDDDYISGFGGSDRLYGDAGLDYISGGADADEIFGGDGNDDLSGGAGADFLSGGTGDDLMYGDTENDRLSGDGGDDFVYGEEGNDQLNGGLGADNLDGGDGFDYAVYSGATSAVVVDLLNAAGGIGEASGDSFNSIEGLYGSNFNDSLYGSNDGDDLHGFEGHDVISGRAGNDYLGGEGGNDQLNGGLGADVLDGGIGFDYAVYTGAPGGVVVDLLNSAGNIGEASGDTFISIEGLYGGSFGDSLYGDGVGNDMQGFGDNDVLDGRGGNDNLGGGDGNDTINGGAGTDIISTGVGIDTIFFYKAEGQGDVVTDFAGNGPGVGDFMYFVGYGTAAQGATFTQVSASQWAIKAFDNSVTDIITLGAGVTVHASDFQFI